MREELTQEDARDEEYRRQEWMQYYVEIGDYASARSLGWDGEPIVAEAAAAGASTQRATTDPNRAATRIQARYRAHARHEKYKDERNEAARLQWIEYYIATKQYDAAREYGWDGTQPSTQTERAATVVQKTYRGFRQREDYKDIRDEESRQQWVTYFLRTGQLDKAAEFGYEPPLAAAPRDAVPKLELAARKPARGAAAAHKQLTCYESITDAFTPRAAKARRLAELEGVLMLQRFSRGLIARSRARLMQREELLYELVSKQEARHAKRIEYYVTLLLANREKNAAFHARAARIQAGYRGQRARAVRRARATEREAARLHKQREEAEAAAAERRREREADASELGAGDSRRANTAVSFADASNANGAANGATGADDELALPRPFQVNPRMSVTEMNTELERGAHIAARQSAEKQRGRELATRVMQGTRGYLKKTSPNALAPQLSAHVRYFYFEAERLCWKKTPYEEAQPRNAKSIPTASITSVLIAEPLDKLEFTLKMSSAEKPYRLKAGSQPELLQWVQALKVVLAVQQETGARNRG
ncbi:hypothetical protein KFE25_010734 [Diacronema lutheri]|uniref:PH domain-containing protein n=1 Tax=Diacronema lutheri TaxID=2081491 RepID=A0A8J5X7B2_DIALT|nr:hypothetical protein KFE25_010734 [Diacronema lutheri]